ncbi:MAG: hypothetical protein SGCHY_002856 [Lobulomycetales sp.]
MSTATFSAEIYVKGAQSGNGGARGCNIRSAAAHSSHGSGKSRLLQRLFHDSGTSAQRDKPARKRSSFLHAQPSPSSDSSDDSDSSDSPQTGSSHNHVHNHLLKDLIGKARRRKSPAASSSGSSDDDESVSSAHSSDSNLLKGLILGSKYKTTHRQSSAAPSSTDQAGMAAAALPSPDNSWREPAAMSRSASTASSASYSSSVVSRTPSETSLAEKWGKCTNIIGRGGQAVVRMCSNKKYAVKEFRKRRRDESEREYVKKLVSEFCISSSMDNLHVIKTVDLIQDEKHHWCVVMEFCSGGDLYHKIHDSHGLHDSDQINCYYKQLVLGVEYLHTMGVAHRDLKPENLLLDASHRVLKISDFGVSEVFRTPFASISQKGHGCAGSGPYIAPEEFELQEYDAELIDVWAIGVIFWVMNFNSLPWTSAQLKDPYYKYYMDHYRRFPCLDTKTTMTRAAKGLMYDMLSPCPESRVSIKGIVDLDWFKHIELCVGEDGVVDETCAPHSHMTCR